MVRVRAMVFKYIILYANFFDNSAISLVNVDVVFFSNFSYHRPPQQSVVLQGYTTSRNTTLRTGSGKKLSVP